MSADKHSSKYMRNNIFTNASCNNIFSHSLMSFYDDANHHNVINQILQDILSLFNADRSYIFLYDFENKVQWYEYEACSKDVIPQKDIIVKVPLTDSSCINNLVFNYKPLIMNDVEDMKELSISEYDILKAQDIKSIIITPITHMDKVLGYIGVDIVKDYRKWREQDVTLLYLLSHIVGASIAIDKKSSKLEKSEANNIVRVLESIYNDIPIGIELYNPSGNIIDINNTDMKIFGITDKWKIMGVSVFDNPVLPEEQKEQLRKGEDFELIFDYDFSKLKDYYQSEFVGETKYISCTGRTIKDRDGKVLYYLLFNSDITGLREIQQKLIVAKEKAEESEKLKMAFLANMSHEIRTPLNAIVGFSDILVVTDEVEEREKFSKIISNNSELLLNLINDILDLSKIEAGVFDYHEELFNLNELFEKFELSFKIRTSDKIILEYRRNREIVSIYFDSNRTSQLLNNFLSNAVKYTTEGKIEFGFFVENGGIRIYVRDTGIGISEENKKRIFKRFEKVDNFAQGTGLGLSICKAMVEHVKGEIGFESELGKGSYFWAWFPCKIVYN